MLAKPQGSRARRGTVWTLLLTLVGTTFAPGSSTAQQTPTEAGLPRSFVAAPGYAAEDPIALTNALEGRLQALGPGRKDADLTPVEKAVLLVDVKEKPLSRVRYLMHVSTSPDAGSKQIFVEVARYNLGPAIRLDAIKEFGARSVGSAESFGVGPHVVWRFAFQPDANAAAALVGAGRTTVADQDGRNRNCAGLPCLGTEKTVDNLATWAEQESKPDASRRPYAKIRKIKAGRETFDEEAPAYTALGLALASGLARSDGPRVTWTGPKPDNPVTFVIDRNLGQDFMSDAAAGPLDGPRSARWVRRFSAVNENAIVATRYEGTVRTP